MTAVLRTARDTFRSLKVRNYRLYFFGQIVSTTGTWMQSVAQVWLVLSLTHSGLALGITTGLQFLPILFLGPLGGLVADRFDKRKVLILTQAADAFLALTLGGLVLAGGDPAVDGLRARTGPRSGHRRGQPHTAELRRGDGGPGATFRTGSA